MSNEQLEISNCEKVKILVYIYSYISPILLYYFDTLQPRCYKSLKIENN